MTVDDNVEPEVKIEPSGLLPEAAPRVLGQDTFSLQAARGASQIEKQHREAEQSGRAICALPNGEFGFLDEANDFIGDQAYLSGHHKSLFGEASSLLESPKPGHKYVWAAKLSPKGDRANAQTMANVRSKRYRLVGIDELRQDLDLPVEEHKFAGEKVAGIVDVILCELTPQAQKQLYQWRAFDAKRKTNRWESFRELQDRVQSMSGGKVTAEIEQKN